MNNNGKKSVAIACSKRASTKHENNSDGDRADALGMIAESPHLLERLSAIKIITLMKRDLREIMSLGIQQQYAKMWQFIHNFYPTIKMKSH